MHVNQNKQRSMRPPPRPKKEQKNTALGNASHKLTFFCAFLCFVVLLASYHLYMHTGNEAQQRSAEPSAPLPLISFQLVAGPSILTFSTAIEGRHGLIGRPNLHLHKEGLLVVSYVCKGSM
jgi:hypothetical protein